MRNGTKDEQAFPDIFQTSISRRINGMALQNKPVYLGELK
jgi:hypothetical protein